MEGAILLKTLTRKSIIADGKNKGLSVTDLLKNKKIDLIYSYFNYSGITFTDDVLDELNINSEDRLKKPGKDPEKYKKYVERNTYMYAKIIAKKVMKKGEDELQEAIEKIITNRNKRRFKKKYKSLIEREKKTFSKVALMRKNHGH
jgi:flavorubredoxin